MPRRRTATSLRGALRGNLKALPGARLAPWGGRRAPGRSLEPPTLEADEAGSPAFLMLPRRFGVGQLGVREDHFRLLAARMELHRHNGLAPVVGHAAFPLPGEHQALRAADLAIHADRHVPAAVRRRHD